MQDDVADVGLVAVFAQIDRLPHAQNRFAVRDGDVDGHVRQNRADVGGHIVRALERVGIKRIVPRRDAVEKVFQIGQNVGIGVFLNGQSGRSVPDEHGQQPRLNAGVLNAPVDRRRDVRETGRRGLHVQRELRLFHL